jgi:hypothetical protein
MKARPPILQQTLISLGNISASHLRTLTSRNMLTRGSKPTDQTIQTPSKPLKKLNTRCGNLLDQLYSYSSYSRGKVYKYNNGIVEVKRLSIKPSYYIKESELNLLV